MFITDPHFYYLLAFNSLILNYIAGTVIIPIYRTISLEYKRNLRIFIIGWYIMNALIGAFGLSIYKNVYHQSAPLYLSHWAALVIIILTAILGLTYAGINPSFFKNPYKLETSKLLAGITIFVLGILLAVNLII